MDTPTQPSSFKGQLISVLAFLSVTMGALSFVIFGAYSQLKRGNNLYTHYQDSLAKHQALVDFARKHPRTREEWMRNSVDSAGFELDTLFVGDTATRELHRDRYYSYLERVDSLLYNDPARGDDIPTPYTEHLDSIKAHQTQH